MNGKEDMRGQRHSREDTFGILGKEALFEIRDCIFLVWSLGGLLQGSIGCWEFWAWGARNPHRILELGSQIGSIPSW
jgi:hypothetical protein